MAAVSALTVLCGAGVGLGLLLVAAGWRGQAVPRRPSRRRAAAGGQRRAVRLAGAVGAGVVVGAVTGWPVAALLAGVAGWTLPGWRAQSRAQAALVARVEAVAGWAEMLRDTMAGAAGLEQAIAASAPLAPAAIRRPVVELAGRLERERLTTALRAFADELADPTADLVVAALLLAADHQARRLGELLADLASAAREQAGMRLRVEAARARTRTSVKVIVAVTVGLAGFLALANHSYLAPYDSAVGQLVLAAVGALFATAFAWLARMTRPAVPDRLLGERRELS